MGPITLSPALSRKRERGQNCMHMPIQHRTRVRHAPTRRSGFSRECHNTARRSPDAIRELYRCNAVVKRSWFYTGVMAPITLSPALSRKRERGQNCMCLAIQRRTRMRHAPTRRSGFSREFCG